MKFNFKVLNEIYAICRLTRNSEIPSWIDKTKFYTISKTDEELSVVCTQNNIPSDIQAEKSWKIIKIDNKLDFSLVGVIANISNVLAKNNISIFVISTFDTDYIMVKENDLEKALKLLTPHLEA